MAREVEVEKFKVEDDSGNIHVLTRFDEYAESEGELLKNGYQVVRMINGSPVRPDNTDPEVFWLPIGLIEPWVKSVRI